MAPLLSAVLGAPCAACRAAHAATVCSEIAAKSAPVGEDRRRKAILAAALSPRSRVSEQAAVAGVGSSGGDSSLGSSLCTDTTPGVDVDSSSSSENGSSNNGSAAQCGTQSRAEPVVPPRGLLPRHLAAIMDGNGRWAAARGHPAAFGYQAGIESLRTVVRCCHDWGVPCLTVYAFSAENWGRPAAEVDALLALMERTLVAEVAELATKGVRLRFIGELGMLPRSMQHQIRSAELATGDNSDMHLTVAISYSGRQDLTLAMQEIARLAAAGELCAVDVTPALIEEHLGTRQLPRAWQQPDLVIRTSGERRLSNFLTWESAYSELYFSDVMWPDFGEEELATALWDYAARERRFGGPRHEQQHGHPGT